MFVLPELEVPLMNMILLGFTPLSDSVLLVLRIYASNCLKNSGC
jgi:hypothetical protein